MVLAAGRGTRLRPLTNDRPKCLMPLAERPLIEWTLTRLAVAGITECVINLHYLPEMVKEFVGDGERYGLGVHYSYEPELLGTAGAVKKVQGLFDKPFYVIYSDNFSQWDIGKLRVAHEKNSAVATIAVHWREDVRQSGMVELDGDNRILRLVEKPKIEAVTSHYVSAGFFYLKPEVFNYIPAGEFCDFGYHVFPRMIDAGERIYAVSMDAPLIGIDMAGSYKKADEWASKLIRQD